MYTYTCLYVLAWTMYMFMSAMLIRFTRGHQIPLKWTYRWFWATAWVLGTELLSSVRAAKTLSCWVISPAPLLCVQVTQPTPFEHTGLTLLLFILLPRGEMAVADWQTQHAKSVAPRMWSLVNSILLSAFLHANLSVWRSLCPNYSSLF